MKLSLVTLFLFTYILQADDSGSLLFNGNCLTCHNETKTISAPSIIEVKKRYKSAFPKKEDFVKYMSKWVIDPNEDSSLMHDFIKKFEIMPHLSYDIETLREISKYIYDTDFTTRGGRYWKIK